MCVYTIQFRCVVIIPVFTFNKKGLVDREFIDYKWCIVYMHNAFYMFCVMDKTSNKPSNRTSQETRTKGAVTIVADTNDVLNRNLSGQISRSDASSKETFSASRNIADLMKFGPFYGTSPFFEHFSGIRSLASHS